MYTTIVKNHTHQQRRGHLAEELTGKRFGLSTTRGPDEAVYALQVSSERSIRQTIRISNRIHHYGDNTRLGWLACIFYYSLTCWKSNVFVVFYFMTGDISHLYFSPSLSLFLNHIFI